MNVLEIFPHLEGILQNIFFHGSTESKKFTAP